MCVRFVTALRVLLVGGLMAKAALGAAFVNLGFDDADTNKVLFGGYGYAWGKTEDFLPGWHLVWGTQTVDKVVIGSVSAADGDATPLNGEGKYALDLFPGVTANKEGIPYSLSQTGDIPQGATTIHFVQEGANFPPFAHFTLSLDGTDIPLTYFRRLSQSWIDANDVYGDISAFAGKTVDLKLTTIPTDLAFDYYIDSISFNVPEPGSSLLLGIGLAWVIASVQANGFRTRS